MIYFIANPDRSRIKIGTTICLSQRLKQLASEHGEGLEVLAVVDGSHDEERTLHRRFAHLRAGDMPGREWFEPGDDLMGFIVSDGKPWDSIDEPKRYRDWLAAISRDSLIPVASIVRDAVSKWAVARGYPVPPER